MEQNAGTETPVIKEEHDNNKGLKVFAAVTSVVVICSIAFNIYEALQVSKKDSRILSLESQIEEKEEIIQSGLIIKTGTDNIGVSDVITAPTEKSTYEDALIAGGSVSKTTSTTQEEPTNNQCSRLVVDYNHEVAMVVASANPHTLYSVYYLFDDGKLIAANRLTMYSLCSQEIDLTAKFSGKIVDLAIREVGNGGLSTLIALLEDGRVETIEEAFEGRNYPEKSSAVSGAEKIVNIYGLYSGVHGVLGRAIDENGEKHMIVIEDASSIPQKFTLQ